MNCKGYKLDQKILKDTVLRSTTDNNQSLRNQRLNTISLKTLFSMKEGIKHTLLFLKSTRIVTRRWILGTLEEERGEEVGWGDIERNV